MSKLTVAQIIAMARAQGIHLQEAGAAPITPDTRAIIGERDSLRLALGEANKANEALSKRLSDAMRAVETLNAGVVRAGIPEEHARELAEARAEIVSLQRTIDRMRGAASVTRGGAAEASMWAEAERAAIKEAREQHQGNVVRITFQGAQGSGTADALKSHGARWTFTNKRGEPVKGYWTAPASPELDNTLLALREAGRAFTAVREFASDTK